VYVDGVGIVGLEGDDIYVVEEEVFLVIIYVSGKAATSCVSYSMGQFM
jgi:hypothetical protein